MENKTKYRLRRIWIKITPLEWTIIPHSTGFKKYPIYDFKFLCFKVIFGWKAKGGYDSFRYGSKWDTDLEWVTYED